MAKPGSKTPAKESAEPKPFDSKKKDEDGGDLDADPRATPYHKRTDKEKEQKANTLPAVLQKKEEKEKAEKEDQLPALHRHDIGHKSVTVHNPNVANMKESRAVRVMEHKQVAHEIAMLNRDGAAVINPHSIKALQHIKPHHLQTASRDIDNNRNQIIDVVGQRIEEHPNLFNRGLKALDKTFQGAKKLTPKDAQAGKRVLTQVLMAGLLATSVLALTMGAGPLAAVSARMLWDIWHHDKEKNKDGKKKDAAEDGVKYGEEKDITPGANDKVGKKALNSTERIGNKIHQKKMREHGFRWHDEEGWVPDPDKEDDAPKQIKADDFAEDGRKKAKGGKSNEVQPRKPKALKHWTEEESEDAEYTTAADKKPFEMKDQHAATINVVLDQLTDLLKFQSPEDIKGVSDRMFSQASAEDVADLYQDIFNAVTKLATSRLAGAPGIMFYGVFNVNINALAEITERVCQVEPEIEIENGQKCFHFESARGLVTVGVRSDNSDQIQFMITEAS